MVPQMLCSKIPCAPNAVPHLLVPQMLSAPKYRVLQWLCPKLQCYYGCAPIAVHLVPATRCDLQDSTHEHPLLFRVLGVSTIKLKITST